MTAPSDAALRLLAQALGERLAAAGQRIATAESCTGGWIAKALTDVAGSSRWFGTGVVCYANEAKSALLGVDQDLLATEGAVSEAIVRAMAVGVLERAAADVSIGVSGIAGPDGGTPTKPVGTVWLAWATRSVAGIRVEARCHQFAGDRDAVRRHAVAAALSGVMLP